MDENRIKRFELQIANLEDQRRAITATMEKLNRMYTMAAIVFIIGLVLCFTPLIPLGVFLVLVAALSAITQTVKKGGQQKEIERINREIRNLRESISSALGPDDDRPTSYSSAPKPIWKDTSAP